MSKSVLQPTVQEDLNIISSLTSDSCVREGGRVEGRERQGEEGGVHVLVEVRSQHQVSSSIALHVVF